MGADINANIGHSSSRDDIYAPSLGPHGLSKQNSKGPNLLTLYMSHDLQVINTCYPAKQTIGHGAWTSIPHTSEGVGEPSMLDVIVCSASLHKRVKNCHVLPDGLESDHCSVCINVVITSIKFKVTTSLNTGTID